MKLSLTLLPEVRLDIAISNQFVELFSRSRTQELIKGNKVTVNGKIVVKPSFTCKKEQTVDVEYDAPGAFELIPSGNNTIPILFQDEHLAIIHKPPSMTVHPGAGTAGDTLVHSLIGQMDSLSDNSPERPGIVHRLDRETEGLMVIAKSNNVHRLLSEGFQERTIKKEYIAWVWGVTPETEIVDGYIGRHPTQRKKMLFSEKKEGLYFKEAKMRYRTLIDNGVVSLLRIKLETGRTHQIRASLSFKKHPVVGDEMYSRVSRRMNNNDLSEIEIHKLKNSGMLLMARRLSFHHPITGEWMDYTLPIPERFNIIDLAEHGIS
jgi:23S rRNA pseudouridine1911/1915/1917 synthase